MRRKWIPALIVLGSLALVGIVVVQLYWIRNAIKVNQEKFDRQVTATLGKVVENLEKKENLVFLNQRMNIDIDTVSAESAPVPSPPPPRPRLKKQEVDIIRFPAYGFGDFGISLDSFIPEDFFEQEEWDVFINIPDLPDISIDDTIRKWSKQVSMSFPNPPKPPLIIRKEPRPPDLREEEERLVKEWERKQHEAGALKKEVTKLNRKVRKMKEMVTQMVVEVETRGEKIEQRIDSVSLRNELDKALANAGIDLPYEYAVLHPGSDSLTPVHSLNFDRGRIPQAYKTSLFPNDLFTRSSQLALYFPDKPGHLLQSASWLMILSALFSLVMVFAFLATVITLLRQKKISEIKTDFINNMTHEFKTPIATISLATDSIDNPRVIHDAGLIRNFTRVIREENHRMNTHVEQVLQMALLDRGQFSLDRQPVDMHELITRAVENILLQVDSKEGSVAIDLQAEQFTIEADEIHLFNAILNLLDNANKYSPEKPQIRVYTRNTGHWLVMGVEDKGIGMDKETRHRIFERFYRVHTGNIHNVKGFGLGLSYVKAIVEAHHGRISVEAEAGKGSCFEIRLPLV